MATVAGQWQNAAGLAYNTTPSVPAGLSLPVTISNTAGDWLFAVCAWRQAASGAGITVSVDDDAHNWWEPLSAPSGDSSPLGVTRCSVWAAPAARVANPVTGVTTVMIAPNGPVVALGAIIVDVNGLAPWLETGFPVVTAYINAGTTINLPGATVPAQSFVLACAAADLSTASVTFSGGAGWTALTGTSTANGTDHTSDLELAAQWRTLSAAAAAPNPQWSASAACDLSGALSAVIVTAAAPAAPNANWPIVITEADPGAGVKTPPSQTAWQEASHRDLGFSFTQGQPYLLGGLQAGQGALTLDNPDISLTPPGAGPWAGLDSGTPVRVRAILPASATPHYVAFSGFIQQLPTSFDAQLRGVIQATLTDVFGYATASLPPCLEAEILTDQPYAYWPLNDPAGSQAASNAAPANPHPLLLTPSKFNTTGVTAAFGAGSGTLKGDSGQGMFTQTGVPSSGVNGFSLACYDSGYPALAGGATVGGWFQFTATTPSGGDVLTLQNSVINVLECKVAGAGTMAINTPANSPISLSTINFASPSTPLWHLAIAFTRTAYTVYINGTIAASGTWSTKLPPAFSAVWVNGNWSPFGRAFGQLYNGTSAHVAVFAGLLPAARIQAHYQAGLNAFAGEPAHYRIERLLAYAGLQGRRVIIPEAPGMPGGFAVAASTPPQDTTPMSSMATLGGTSPSLIAPGVPGFTPGSGTQANSALVATALSTAPALLTVAPTGGMAYTPRGYSANQPVRWVLGDGPGEIPVLPDLAFGYDPGYVRNVVSLTQPDTGTSTSPSIATVQAQSQAQYGGQSYSATGYLLNDATAGNIQAPIMTDLANWIAAVNATPRLRAGPVTVRASHLQPAVAAIAWPFVLGAAPGDIVVVNARPPASPGAVISVTARIMQVKRTLAFGADGTEGSAQVTLDAAPEENVLACDDVARGLLNGTSVIGW